MLEKHLFFTDEGFVDALRLNRSFLTSQFENQSKCFYVSHILTRDFTL